MLDIYRGVTELKRPQLSGYGETIISLLEKRDKRISETRDLTHILNPYYDKINPEAILDPKDLFKNSFVKIVIHNDFHPSGSHEDNGETWDYCAIEVDSRYLISSFENIKPGEYKKISMCAWLDTGGYFCEDVRITEKIWIETLKNKDIVMELYLSKNLDQFNLKISWPDQDKRDDPIPPLAVIRAWQ